MKKQIGVLDGFRAFAVLQVMAFHFWQQSWLGGFKITLFSKTFEVMPYTFFSTGAIWVDMLLLLSAFLLFLPYARSVTGGGIKTDGTLKFYRKRIARIAPSVYFHMAVLMIFIIRVSDYRDGLSGYFEDFFKNLFFLQNCPSIKDYPQFADGSMYTHTLWTLSVEMLFYLLFPLIAFCFKKKPLITFSVMALSGEAYINFFAVQQINNGNWVAHRLFPTYLPVFAIGMAAAVAFAYLEKIEKPDKIFTAVATSIAIASVYITIKLVWYGYGADNTQLWQVKNRMLFAFVNSVTILSVCYSARWLKALFSNPVTHFLSRISFNMYIWHQFFAVYLKKWNIPSYPEAPKGAYAWPQQGGFDGYEAWQWKYIITLWAATIITATLVTLFIEEPLGKLIKGEKYGKFNKRQSRL